MPFNSEFIEHHWPLTRVQLGDHLKAVAGIRAVGRIYSVEGDFIYKIADESKTRDTLSQSLVAFELLPQRGFSHIPSLQKTKGGRSYEECDGKFIYIIEFIKGKNPESTPKSYGKLGQLTAELHSITDYPYQTLFSPAKIIAEDLPTLAEGRSFNEEYVSLVKSLPLFDNLPQAVIHSDISPGNSVERPNGDVVLVDLDDIGMGARILDLAFPLIQQFISEDCEYSEANAKAFFDAYQAKITLTPREVDHIFPAALFIALMYIIYGDMEKRWKRIQWAIANRKILERAYLK